MRVPITVPYSALFHFLLTRLGRVKSRVAAHYCLTLLAERPEETEAVLRYFGDIGLSLEEKNAILRYASLPDAIYDYQLYQIAQWFFDRSFFPRELVSLCRKWAFDNNRDPWLRSYSIAILGAAGDRSDLEMLESGYTSARTEIERAEIVAALARMEGSRRNSFYGRVKNDGELVRRAVEQERQRKSASL